MEIKIYEGKLGKEQFLCKVNAENIKTFYPQNLVKGGLITGLPNLPEEVFEIKQVLYDYGEHSNEESFPAEINLFVKVYDWE